MLIVRALSRLVLMFLRMSVKCLCRILMLMFAGLGPPLAHASLSRRHLWVCLCTQLLRLGQLRLMLRLYLRLRLRLRSPMCVQVHRFLLASLTLQASLV